MPDKKFSVVGIGNAIVDVIANVDDDFLAKHTMKKGSMQLISEDEARQIYGAIDIVKEMPGGSAANTIAGLASFGSKTAFIGKVKDDPLGSVFERGLKSLGVNCNTRKVKVGIPTGYCVVLVTPDVQRTMNTFLGASETLRPDDIDEDVISDSGITYLEGYLWSGAESKKAFLKAIEIHLEFDQQINQTEKTTLTTRGFYQYLEQNNFPQNEIRDVINTLEQVYNERYPNSLHNIESTSLKVLAQFGADKDALRYLQSQISTSFQRQFNTAIVKFSDQIKAFAESSELTKSTFDNGLSELLSTYQQKFNCHYETKADKELAVAKHSIEALAKRQQSLAEQLKDTEQLLAEKNTLLDKIQQLLPTKNNQPDIT